MWGCSSDSNEEPKPVSPPSQPLSVTTQSATPSSTTNSALLQGRVFGGDSIIEVGFIYYPVGTVPNEEETNVTKIVLEPPANSFTFDFDVSDLAYETTYVYKAYAIDANGRVDGEEEWFTTLKLIGLRFTFSTELIRIGEPFKISFNQKPPNDFKLKAFVYDLVEKETGQLEYKAIDDLTYEVTLTGVDVSILGSIFFQEENYPVEIKIVVQSDRIVNEEYSRYIKLKYYEIIKYYADKIDEYNPIFHMQTNYEDKLIASFDMYYPNRAEFHDIPTIREFDFNQKDWVVRSVFPENDYTINDGFMYSNRRSYKVVRVKDKLYYRLEKQHPIGGTTGVNVQAKRVQLINGFGETILKDFYTDYNIWSYDLSTNQWEKLEVAGINFHPLFEHNDLLYFYDPSDLFLKSYNPDNQEIKQITSIFIPTFAVQYADVLQNTDWELIDENRVMVLRHKMEATDDDFNFIEEVGVVDLATQKFSVIEYPPVNQVNYLRVLDNELYLHGLTNEYSVYKYENDTWELQNSRYLNNFFMYDKLMSKIQGRIYAVQQNSVGEIFPWKK